MGEQLEARSSLPFEDFLAGSGNEELLCDASAFVERISNGGKKCRHRRRRRIGQRVADHHFGGGTLNALLSADVEELDGQDHCRPFRIFGHWRDRRHPKRRSGAATAWLRRDARAVTVDRRPDRPMDRQLHIDRVDHGTSRDGDLGGRDTATSSSITA